MSEMGERGDCTPQLFSIFFCSALLSVFQALPLMEEDGRCPQQLWLGEWISLVRWVNQSSSEFRFSKPFGHSLWPSCIRICSGLLISFCTIAASPSWSWTQVGSGGGVMYWPLQVPTTKNHGLGHWSYRASWPLWITSQAFIHLFIKLSSVC